VRENAIVSGDPQQIERSSHEQRADGISQTSSRLAASTTSSSYDRRQTAEPPPDANGVFDTLFSNYSSALYHPDQDNHYCEHQKNVYKPA